MNELLPGTEVFARGLRWEVVFAEKLGPQTLYRLRGLEGAVIGEEFDLLMPFETIDPVRHDFQPEKAAPLRNWRVYHEAFLLDQCLGGDALLAVQPGRLRLEPYQLVPVLRAIRMSRPRLMLADGVGLGKSVQAGLVLTELIARRIAHRILIVSPAGLLLAQWEQEMRTRFGLRLQVVDRALLDEIRRRTELGANPFDHIPLGLVSLDFLKQEKVLEHLERTTYDVVVIDEAHHCMDLGSAAGREDSLRHRLAEVLARRCDALLLLTATPHDGNDSSFASLCELLDPSLVDGRGELREGRYHQHVIRRLKIHIKDPRTGKPLFPDRQVMPSPVTADATRHAAFMDLHRSLVDLIAPELKRAFRSRRYEDVLSFLALLKRSVSTVAACRATLGVVANRFGQILDAQEESIADRRQRIRTLRECHKKISRFGVGTPEEEDERHQLESEDFAQQLASLNREIRQGKYHLKHKSDVAAALADLLGLADRAVGMDPKLERLVQIVQEIRRQEPRANILIYTEYIDSQVAVVEALRAAGIPGILTLSGGGADDEAVGQQKAKRQDVTTRFQENDNLILVSTDAAAEGLNLHQRCHHLIHLELPFNPNRLEQRNGRIDRYGQDRTPNVHYLYLAGTFEERILFRLIAKYERQRKRLTFVPNTLGLATASDLSNERLLQSMLEEESRLFQSGPVLFDLESPREDEGADAATQALLEEIEHSLKGFVEVARSHTWLGDAGLNAQEENLQQAGTALAAGETMSAVDLARFVADAVLLDGGDINGRLMDDEFELVLPPAWVHDLEDIPGMDPASRRARLTTRADKTSGANGQPLGFLGRAHPLVRRALDRVRHLSLGEGGLTLQDTRVSAVKTAESEPAMIFTFLGRVSSGAGREFERVLAVKVAASSSAEFLAAPSDWLADAQPDRAIPTAGVWERVFARWSDAARETAIRVAGEGFSPIAEAYMQERRKTLAGEVEALRQWLRDRIDTVIPKDSSGVAQKSLFEPAADTQATTRPDWWQIKDPTDRLAGFALDRSQPPHLRSAAESVLTIYRQRSDELRSRQEMTQPEVVPLGLLMLVPEGRHGV